MGLQPFNYADFKVISEHSQFNVVEMHVYTPNDIFIVEFKEKFTYTEEIDKALNDDFGIGFLAGANKGEIGRTNQIWDNYLNDSILNEYMEFRRIRK
ncbi:MAG: hypothetical protein PUC09_03285 [Methanobrevibacter wolinii]|nr:hypothetical protein [Methanobrevibacter wolinii]